MTTIHDDSDRAVDDTYADRKLRQEVLRSAKIRLLEERVPFLSLSRVDGQLVGETFQALVSCQHTLSDLLRIVMSIGARPGLRRPEVLDYDEALFVCMQTQIVLDDAYLALLRHDEPEGLSIVIEELVRDGALTERAQGVREAQ